MLRALIRLYFLMLCINVGIFWVSNAFSVDLGGRTALDERFSTFTSQTETLNISVIPLGDFIAGIQVFFNIISGGYVLQILGLFNFSADFMFGIQVILAFMTVLATIYMISNRVSL